MTSQPPQTFAMTEVGVATTELKERREAPQQPGGHSHVVKNASGVRARIDIHAEFRGCLQDLEGFDRVWLLYVFHRNSGWRPTVKPPRRKEKRGLFATRGPHRPTPIGLTSARLLSVGVDHIEVDEVDLLDGTPVVDIKPYLAFADAFPHAKAGWVDATRDVTVDVSERDVETANVAETEIRTSVVDTEDLKKEERT